MVEKKETKKEKKTFKLSRDQTIALYRNKEQELNAISSKMKEIDNLYNEIMKAEQTLNEMKTVKDNEKLLVNVGAGILVECNIENKKTAKITLPGNIVVDKDIHIILKDIEKRKEELSKLKKQFTDAYNKNVNLLQRITGALNQIESESGVKQNSNVN